MMFPYPSAEGLHVGNLFAFTGNDIYGRFQRLQGHTSSSRSASTRSASTPRTSRSRSGVHPMRPDPAEHRELPAAARARRADDRLAHELSTRPTRRTTSGRSGSSCSCFKRGLAYKKKAAVNWCPADKTVLANEQVIARRVRALRHAGRAALPGAVVLPDQRLRRAAARQPRHDRLVGDARKTAQRNWIGRVRGRRDRVRVGLAEFAVRARRRRRNSAESRRPHRSSRRAPDTVFGATYMVLAPEHPLVEPHHDATTQRDAVERVSRARRRSRTSSRARSNKEKTGVFTGAYAVEPGDGRADPDLDRRLRAHGVRHRRDHGRARARRARLRVRDARSACRSCASSRRRATTPTRRSTEAFTDDEAGALVNSGQFDGTAGRRRRSARSSPGSSERGHGEARS